MFLNCHIQKQSYTKKCVIIEGIIHFSWSDWNVVGNRNIWIQSLMESLFYEFRGISGFGLLFDDRALPS